MFLILFLLAQGPHHQGFIVEVNPQDVKGLQKKSLVLEPVSGFGTKYKAEFSGTLEEIRTLPGIISAQYNYVYEGDAMPNDPKYLDQWAFDELNMTEVWDIVTGDPNVVIAVIGRGVQTSHEDLKNQLWHNPGETIGNSDGDGNGKAGDLHGWNFKDGNHLLSDENNHETAVAGIALAQGNNAKGIAGVCWGCKLMTIKINYESIQVAQAIRYAIAEGATIINMSFGSYEPFKYGPDSVVQDAILEAQDAGILCVATAGNHTINSPRFPAAHPEVISVGATRSDGQLAEFSNWGNWIDIAAPGSSMLSTNNQGEYDLFFGTSFAAPFISGLAGLVWSKHPDWDLAQVKAQLMASLSSENWNKPVGLGLIQPKEVVGVQKELFAHISDPWQGKVALHGLSFEVEVYSNAESVLLDIRREGEAWSALEMSGFSPWQRSIVAQIDTTNLMENTRYDLRIKAFRAGKEIEKETFFVTSVSGMSYFSPGLGAILNPPTFLTSDEQDVLWLQGGNIGTTVMMDLQGNAVQNWPTTSDSPYLFGAMTRIKVGLEEAVLTTSYGAQGQGTLTCFDLTGNILWKRTLGQMRGSAIQGDFRDEPGLEIVVTDRNKLWMLNELGQDVQGFPVDYEAFGPDNAPAAFDFDRDGFLEIVVSMQGQTRLYSGNGEERLRFPHGNSSTSPILVDLDFDHVPELVFRSKSTLFCTTWQGEVIWTAGLPGLTYGSLSAGYMGDKGTPIIVCVGSTGTIQNPEPSRIFAYTSLGQPLPGYPLSIGLDANHEAIFVDLNVDGVDEIVIGDGSGALHAYNRSGQSLPGFPLHFPGGIASAATAYKHGQNFGIAFGTVEGDLYYLQLESKDDYQTHWSQSRGQNQRFGLLSTQEVGQAPVEMGQMVRHLPQDPAFGGRLVLEPRNDQNEVLIQFLDEEGSSVGEQSYLLTDSLELDQFPAGSTSANVFGDVQVTHFISWGSSELSFHPNQFGLTYYQLDAPRVDGEIIGLVFTNRGQASSQVVLTQIPKSGKSKQEIFVIKPGQKTQKILNQTNFLDVVIQAEQPVSLLGIRFHIPSQSMFPVVPYFRD